MKAERPRRFTGGGVGFPRRRPGHDETRLRFRRRLLRGRSWATGTTSGVASGREGSCPTREGGQTIEVESGLQTYLRQINKAPLLTAEEERELAGMIRRAQQIAEEFARGECTYPQREQADQEASIARERMVRSNLRLVVNIAKKYAKRGMPLSDLINEGNLGLMRAVEGFDPNHDTRFSTYASWWIKQAIKRSLINSVQPIHIPAYMVEMIARWRQAHDAFVEKEGRPPTLSELAAYLMLPERKVRIIRRAVKAFASPTQSADDESGMPLAEMLADQKTPRPEEAMFSESETALIQEMLNAISEREAKILRMRFGLGDGEPMTLKDIGKAVGLTRERVRQIEGEALRKLNELINARL